MNKLSGTKFFLLLAAGYILLEFLSWIGYNQPILSTGLFFVVVLSVMILTWFRPGLGVIAVLGELFVGSQGGYMLALGSANIDGAILSLRMGLFLAVFGVWLTRTVLIIFNNFYQKRLGKTSNSNNYSESQRLVWLTEMRALGLLWPYLVLLSVFVLGAGRGIVAGHGFNNVFFDANGYAFFALFPAFIEGLQDLRARRWLWYVLAAAITISVFKALAVLYFFAHRMFYIAANMYVWVRDTRVGEITLTLADFHRVFFQSHLFVLAGLFVVFLLAVQAKLFRGLQFWLPFILFAWGLVAMLLGLSRSYWFGGFFGFLMMIALLIWTRCGQSLWKKMLIIAPAGLLLATGIVAFTYAFPYPDKTGEMSLTALMGRRAFSLTGEAAANSRWELLAALWPIGFEHPVFGSGLGQEVTYTTSDPRLIADMPDAQYTTYAFEWGYHDLWIKFGLIGLLAYSWLIAAILKPYLVALKLSRENKNLQNKKNVLIIIGITAGTVAMLVTNLFSPYLNHPLGIGLLMAVAALKISDSFWSESV